MNVQWVHLAPQNIPCAINVLTITLHCIVDSMSLLQKVKSGMGSPDIHLRKLLWVYCHRVKGNDRADRLAGKGTIASGLLLRRSDVWRNSRHYLREQSQGRHTTDRLEERGMERESARWSSLKGWERAIVNQRKMIFFKRMREGHCQSDEE